MKGDCSPIGRFETYLLILSFCTSKWRKTEDIIQYFDIPLRTGQRYVKQLVDSGYLERKGDLIGSTRKAYIMLMNGIK